LEHLDRNASLDPLLEPYRVPTYNSLNLVGSRCELSSGGALLLPGVAAAESLEATVRRGLDASTIPTVVRASVADPEASNASPNLPSSPFPAPASSIAAPSSDVPRDVDVDFPAAFDDGADDRDDGGPGFAFFEDDDDGNHRGGGTPATAAGLRSAFKRSSRAVGMPPRPAIGPKKTVTFEDPWELLDPHQPLGTYRPLRKGRTLALPNGLPDLPSDCVTGARTKRRAGRVVGSTVGTIAKPSGPAPIPGSYATNTYRHLTQGTDLFELPLSGLAFGDEFAYIAKRNKQAKEAEKRKARREAQGAQPSPRSDEVIDGNDDDDDAGFGALGGDDDDEADRDDYEQDNGGAMPWDNDDGGGGMGNAGLMSVDDVFRGDGTRECFAMCSADQS
jgi:hypothetical protein